MRLTLRTLLAWLDDTLQPTQVREIGRQVSESPLAQELAERIHRVSRQRRLSVPGRSGPDGTDPNLVASYLDNELDPEAVAEYEKKCLTSDVNLAEVASVHQILSLLGQRVRVPDEARSRMYQLVKGREAVSHKRPEAKPLWSPEPITQPIQPWVVPASPARSWVERLGPAAACVFLIFLTSFLAWKSLTVPASRLAPPLGPEGSVAGPPSAPMAGEAQPQAGPAESSEVASTEPSAEKVTEPEPGESPERDMADTAAPGARKDVGKVTKASESAAKSKEAAVAAVAAGAAGLAEAADNVLLRYAGDRGEWERLADSAPVNRSDRLLCLAPFRSTITLGKIVLMLLGETEVRVLSGATDKVPVLELIQGRILVRQPPSSPITVVFSDRPANFEASTEGGLALERVDRRAYGQPVSQPPPLTVYCIRGDMSLTVDQQKESLSPSSVDTIDVAGHQKRSSQDTPPPWATGASPPPAELQVRDRFIKMFHPGRPVLAEIVGATEDESPEVKQLSVSALKALGDLSLLMPVLDRPKDPVARRGAISAIRTYMGLGPEAARRVREQLDEEFGRDKAAFVERMLLGFGHEEASNPDVFRRLVTQLTPEQDSIGIRELALDNLKRLTGRDDRGYDPDNAEGKGLTAWKDLLSRGELRPATGRPRTKPE